MEGCVRERGAEAATSEPPLRGDEGAEMRPTEEVGGEIMTGDVGGAG